MRTKFWILSLLAVTLLVSLHGLRSKASAVVAATAEPTAAATMGGMPGMNMDSGYSTNDLAPLARSTTTARTCSSSTLKPPIPRWPVS
jgi:hypothetical protein